MNAEDFTIGKCIFFRNAARNAGDNSKETIKVGGCLVKDGKIVGCSWNGLPRVNVAQLNKNVVNQALKSSPHANFYICEAVTNTIAFSTGSLKGATLFTTHFPSCEAVRMIVQYDLAGVYIEWSADFNKAASGNITDSKEAAEELLNIYYPSNKVEIKGDQAFYVYRQRVEDEMMSVTSSD